MSEHHLKISPAENGVWLSSNGRTLFFDHAMWDELVHMTELFNAAKRGATVKNYEEPERPLSRPLAQTAQSTPHHPRPKAAKLEDLI